MATKKTLPEDFTLPAGFRPVGITAHRSQPYPPPPDWKLWGSMYDVELWQAAALSLNINPDTIKDPDRFNFDEYKDRLRLLKNWLAPQKRIMLCELAGRWSKVLKWQIPPELEVMASLYDELTNKEADAPAAKVEAGTDTTPAPDTNGEVHTGLDGAPPLQKGKNTRDKVDAWVKFQAKAMLKDGDNASDLVARIYLEANKWGYQSERTNEGETISKATITKLLPEKVTGGRGKNRGKSKK